ncbi:MAG: hypothetical protein AAF551_10095 [Bacteroidota bacterium]
MRGVLLVVLAVFFFISTYSQNKPLSDEKWEKLRAKVEYSKSGTKNKSKKQAQGTESEKGKKSTPLASEGESSGSVLNLGPIVQILIIVLFIGFIAALLYLLITNISVKKNPDIEANGGDLAEKIEDNFTMGNLEKWLKHAIEQKDYYLMLRVYFLLALKNLENHKLIIWKKEKTNWNYIQELNDHHFQPAFIKMVNEFDRLWYGEKGYSEEELISKIKQFKQFAKSIDSR